MPKTEITYHDLLLVKNWAKDFLVQLPTGARLEGSNYVLTEGDRLAASYIHAVLNLLGHADTKVHITTSDSESIHEP